MMKNKISEDEGFTPVPTLYGEVLETDIGYISPVWTFGESTMGKMIYIFSRKEYAIVVTKKLLCTNRIKCEDCKRRFLCQNQSW